VGANFSASGDSATLNDTIAEHTYTAPQVIVVLKLDVWPMDASGPLPILVQVVGRLLIGSTVQACWPIEQAGVEHGASRSLVPASLHGRSPRAIGNVLNGAQWGSDRGGADVRRRGH
jgi:hypothetical protein